jgi:hypothetical protein
MVFKTSQMLLLTSPAKARGKEEVRRTALPSALYTKNHVHSHAVVGPSATIGRWTAGPPNQIATAVRRVPDRTTNWPASTATRRNTTILVNESLYNLIGYILSFVIYIQSLFV